MFDYIYKKLYILGLFTARYLSRFFRGFLRIIKKPIKALGMLFYAAFLVVDKLVIRSFRAVADEVKELADDAKRVSSDINSVFKGDKKQGAKVFHHYVKKAFAKHGLVFSFLTNVVTPIAALVIMCLTISHWSSKNLALKITYNNNDIGYVNSESVYLQAEDEANERLKTATVANEGQSLVKTAQYEITPVQLSDLNDSESICNKIIEKSDDSITSACGIYIDGSFLCAVKNESDATTVFDNILNSYDAGDKNAVVSFVENISYVQGLYPDNSGTIWDADELSKKLSTKKSEANYYTVVQGDTVSGIAQKFGLTTSQVYALNPSVAEQIHIGDKILVSSEVNFVRVQVTKTETRTESIPYSTVQVENPSLYKNVKKTVQKGSNGQQLITELVTYIDGVRVGSKEISRVTTVNPVDEKIQVGSKSYTSSYGTMSSGGTVTSYGGKFVWPVIGAYNISSTYGSRSSGYHGGVDIVKPGGNTTGSPVVAAASGTVVVSTYHYSWGNYVIIDHGNGLSTLYAHMMNGSVRVQAGQSVSQGQQIGNVGATGNATGPHLHFEVRVNGNRTNPLPYLGK